MDIDTGDIACINGHNYEVTKNDEHGIWVGESLIYFTNGDWKVNNYNVSHTITFKKIWFGLSGVQEIDMLIMINLDLPSLLQSTEVSQRYSQISSDNHFWKMKVDHDYGVSRHKPDNETYKQQYKILYQIHTPNQAVDDDRLDSLIYFERNNQLPNINGANIAIYNNNKEILIWLHDRQIHPDVYGVDMALGRGLHDIVEYIITLGIHPTQLGIDIATQSGYINTVKWGIRNGLMSFNVNVAARYGHLDILRLLSFHGILPTLSGMNAAVKYGHIDVIIWMVQSGIHPTAYTITAAVLSCQLMIMNWLIQNTTLMPTIADVDKALIISGSLTIIRTICKHKIYPTVSGLDNYAKMGSTKMYEFMAVRGVYPTSVGAGLAANAGKNNVLDWMAQHNILPDSSITDSSILLTNGTTLTWLLQHNIFPTQDRVDWADPSMLTILASFRIYPSQNRAIREMRKSNIPMLDWLATFGVYPSTVAANTLYSTSENRELIMWLVRNNIRTK